MSKNDKKRKSQKGKYFSKGQRPNVSRKFKRGDDHPIAVATRLLPDLPAFTFVPRLVE